MARVYVGVGSNIDPQTNISRALHMLAGATAVVAISTFYRTAPIGFRPSPEFVNGVIAVETEIEPREFKCKMLRGVEKALGRLRGEDKNEPRTIDLDILLYGDTVVSDDDLIIPDPNIAERAFVALPLTELDPSLALPGSDELLADLAGRLPTDDMMPLEDFTKRLRQEMKLEP